jgi:hypothetical protein
MAKAGKTILTTRKKKKLPKASKPNKPMDLNTMLQNDIQVPII